MKKNNLQQYFKQCQDKGIYEHHIRATDNDHNVLFYIHPIDSEDETLYFNVTGNELKQLHVSPEDDLRETLTDIINGLPMEKLKEVANQFGLNYQ